MKRYNFNRYIPYLLLVPSMAILLLFLYWPTIQAFIMSFYRVAPFGVKKIYVGFSNYLNLYANPTYLGSLGKTALFVIMVIVIGLSISLLLAVLANQRLKGIRFYRTIFFLPYAISPVVAGSLWVFLLNPVAGHINYILHLLFNVQPAWLTTGYLAFTAVAIATIWKNMGFNLIFFLAGLQSIPESVYESARIDGANGINTFFKITIPLLSPTTFYLIIMNIIFSVFDSFGIIDIMTQGGPADATNLAIYNLYRDSFVNFRPGRAAAQSVVLLFLVILVTVIHFKTGSRRVHYQ